MTNKIKIFTPIESRNPIYLGKPGEDLFESILEEHNGTTLAEVKEDGYRIQIHKKDDQVMAFTRQMNAYLLDLYPEIQTSLQHLPNCILDAELIGEGRIGNEGFNLVKSRFRARISDKGTEKYLQSGLVEEAPLALRVFDTLYWESKSLLNQSLQQRRKITENILESKISPSEQRKFSDPKQLELWFKQLVGSNYEGLVCKNPSSLYCPGARDNQWIKVKRAETLDLAVLGVYVDNNQISQLLCGTFNPETGLYETLAKVNAKREGMNNPLESLLSRNYVATCPENVCNLSEEISPQYWINPKDSVVVEIAAMNISRGKNEYSCGYDGKTSYSLRIGWLKSIREDKSVSQTSTNELVKKLYLAGKE
jgi:DNA ligase-1